MPGLPSPPTLDRELNPELRAGRTYGILLAGVLLIVVGAGNIYVARSKIEYYRAAYWKSAGVVANRSPRLPQGSHIFPQVPRSRPLPKTPMEHDSVAARRALSRVEYYNLVEMCGISLVTLGGIGALFWGWSRRIGENKITEESIR